MGYNNCGRHKSELRILLEKTDLISLLENNSQKEIADLFGATIAMVYKEFEIQFKKRNVGFKEEHYNFSKEDELIYEDAWMNSEERKSLMELNQ